MFTFSTRKRLSPSTLSTCPRWPRLLPAITITSSPLRIRSIMCSLQNFRGQGDDLHEPLRTQLARHRAKDTCTDRLQLLIQQNRRVAVETDQRSIMTSHTLARPHDHSVIHLALLDLAARNGILDGHLDDVADICVPALGSTQHLDTHQFASATVVGRRQSRLHLNHAASLRCCLLGALDDFHHLPALVLRERTALGNTNGIAFVAVVCFIVRMHLARTANVLAVQRVLDQALQAHGDRLVHLVADNATDLAALYLFFSTHADSPCI